MMPEDNPNPAALRETHIACIRDLLAAVGLTEEQLNDKIDAQLQISDGLDALGFVELEKVISWLENKRETKGRASEIQETRVTDEH